MQRFAYELRKLRREAGGLAYREMARRAHYSVTALSRAAAGEQLPSLEVTLAYVRACGGDVGEWQRRWRETAEESAVRNRDGDDAASPYQGLARFEPDDHERFFGRGELVADLGKLVRSRRFTAVFGPSGSGKSSLLRAGLIPALRGDGATEVAAIRILTPGGHLLRAHEEALLPKETDGHIEGDTLVVVDQFEEVFTLCRDPGERAGFIDQLLAARQPESRLRVVIAVRADFYGRCAEHRRLADALREASLLVGPMTPAELREAVVRPAQMAGLIVERELTARLVEEVDGEPGGLPLLSHALRETWRRRRGRVLTVEAYEAAGGVHGAIAQSAEEVYTRLSLGHAELARLILLRLIAPGEGSPDTRRPVARGELDLAEHRNDVAVVLDRLARARLITLGEDTVDLAHEALITGWPRLRGWIEEDRERLRAHRRLTEAAQAWNDLDRDPGALYRGTRLTAAEEAFATTDKSVDLTTLEQDFLTSSSIARHREEQAAARTTRRLRQFAATLSILLVLALAAGLIAWQQYRTSEQQRHQALSAQHIALSRQLAAQSAGLRGANPDVASLLAVQAYRTSPTKEAAAGLFAAAALPLQRRLTGHTDGVDSVAFSPDGRTLASGSYDKTLRLWDVATGKLRTTLTGYTGTVLSVAFSPDGRTLASGSADKTVRLWDVATGKLRSTLTRHIDTVWSVAFSPDGRTLASGSADKTVRLWDVATGKLRTTLTGHTGIVRSVAFSPDGRTLASGSGDKTLRLWDVATGKLRTTLTGHTRFAALLAFSPDGHTLASGGEDGKARLWDVPTGKLRTTLTGHTRFVTSLAFSPDGHTLASGGEDGKARLWDVPTGRLRTTLTGHTDAVESLAFSPNGRTLASASLDKTLRLWNVPTGKLRTTLTGHTDAVESVAFSPDGRTLASAGEDGKIRLWDAATGKLRTTLAADADLVRAVAFSPDGRTLASAGEDGNIRLWDAATGRLRSTLTGHHRIVQSVAFSPDGHTLASASGDKTVRLWDMATRKLRTTLTGHTDIVWSVAFSPNSHTVVGGEVNGKLRLWDVATGKLRTTLTGPTDFIESVAFSPDGRTLAGAGEDEKIRMWDVPTRKLRTTLAADADLVRAVAFSPDGRTLAGGEEDGKVQLWDVATGKLRTTLTGHTDIVWSVAFSPDGRTLTSGGEDGKIRLWDVSLPDPTSAIRKICRAVHRSFTQGERSVYLADQPINPVCQSRDTRS